MQTSESNGVEIDQAARWYARCASRRMNAADWRKLEAWCNAASNNRKALQSMARLSRLSGRLGSNGGSAVLQDSAPDLLRLLEDHANFTTLAKNGFRKSRQALLAAAGLVAALLVPVMYYVATDDFSPAATGNYRTDPAERMTVELPDGTNLVLNAASEVTLHHSDHERRLTLHYGEVYLDVAHDPVRPFRVEVDDYLVTVSGTAFEVRSRHGTAQLIVNEGRVVVTEVQPTPGVAASEVSAGQKLLLEPGESSVNLSAGAVAREFSWRDGWLHVQDQRLDVVVRKLEPYLGVDVVFDGNRSAALRVSGSFNMDRASTAMDSLASILPISIVYESDRIFVSYKAR